MIPICQRGWNRMEPVEPDGYDLLAMATLDLRTGSEEP